MNKYCLTGAAAALLFCAAGAMAEDKAAPATPESPPGSIAAAMGGMPKIHEMTLEEARKKAHERADKLDKMTQAEWDEQQKERREFMDRFAKMTPADRQAMYQSIIHGGKPVFPEDKPAAKGAAGK